jgi:hypothetical protein
MSLKKKKKVFILLGLRFKLLFFEILKFNLIFFKISELNLYIIGFNLLTF